MTTAQHIPSHDARINNALSKTDFSFAPWNSLPALEVPQALCTASRPVCLLERLVAAFGLILISPLLLAIALAVKLDSPGGSVFFKQKRVGLDRRQHKPDSSNGDGTFSGPERRQGRGLGSTFHVLKFRTMVPDAEKFSGPMWALENDPRITRVGRILRHLRVDELPQLVNVVRGEMRLIGPRPERPYFVEKLASEIPYYGRRLSVPPGITGLAQIERNYDESVDDVRTKVKYDLYYAKNRSLVLDTKIILKTVDVVLRGRGAR